MKDLAPNIFRQRLLIEGFYNIKVDEDVILNFFDKLVKTLKVDTYGKAIVHHTSGKGKEMNQGYDAFRPIVDSGIYLGAWTNQKFISIIIYSCKEFNTAEAVNTTKEFWKIKEIDSLSF